MSASVTEIPASATDTTSVLNQQGDISMISLDTPLAGLDGSCLKDFWQLPVSKKGFDFQPKYYFGQILFHKMKMPAGEILHPVEIIGIQWMGVDWTYYCELPEDHPKFEEGECEALWLDVWQLEAM